MTGEQDDKVPGDPAAGAAEPEDQRPGGVGDLVRRALLAGVGAVFMTEEQIRKGVQELKLPKEALGYVAGQAEKTRTEATRVLRKELRRFLNSTAFKDQLKELLTGITLEVKAEVRLKPAPSIGNARVRVKPSEKDEG